MERETRAESQAKSLKIWINFKADRSIICYFTPALGHFITNWASRGPDTVKFTQWVSK